ncbi:hypothetical protein [Rhodanobacter sp. A1T4]|uniref:hypothetical protein n=1 Tax=Rhodanobacter sp. A1T4 TaxID=2723087 RepID=UPI00161EA23B|nr:hypothetical protein [Rhodanobacter sp. A1T4]MBB6246736.1 hypothetical protein [Rhodanobacter sp. A1T4]
MRNSKFTESQIVTTLKKVGDHEPSTARALLSSPVRHAYALRFVHIRAQKRVFEARKAVRHSD